MSAKLTKFSEASFHAYVIWVAFYIYVFSAKGSVLETLKVQYLP